MILRSIDSVEVCGRTSAPQRAPVYSSTTTTYVQPGVVVSTQPGPPAYISPPAATVIEYRDAYGRPYGPPPDPYATTNTPAPIPARPSRCT